MRNRKVTVFEEENKKVITETDLDTIENRFERDFRVNKLNDFTQKSYSYKIGNVD